MVIQPIAGANLEPIPLGLFCAFWTGSARQNALAFEHRLRLTNNERSESNYTLLRVRSSLRAVRVQTGCANNAQWDRFLDCINRRDLWRANIAAR